MSNLSWVNEYYAKVEKLFLDSLGTAHMVVAEYGSIDLKLKFSLSQQWRRFLNNLILYRKDTSSITTNPMLEVTNITTIRSFGEEIFKNPIRFECYPDFSIYINNSLLLLMEDILAFDPTIYVQLLDIYSGRTYLKYMNIGTDLIALIDTSDVVLHSESVAEKKKYSDFIWKSLYYEADKETMIQVFMSTV